MGIALGSGVNTSSQMKHAKEDNGAGNSLKADQEKRRQQKYWKHVIRKILYQLMFLITQPNGLFYQYLQNNAINYSCTELVESGKLSKTSKLDEEASMLASVTPLNLSITKSMLSFMREIFAMPDRFTKYVFDEELLLFYIRTTYISFVKLYNKNFNITKVQEEQQMSAAREGVGSGESPPPPSLKDQKKQRAREFRKEASLSLCKKHVQCLFAIAKNRNEDTRRKLFQFKIVQFLLQEIGLEFEVQQRRERFLKLSKEQ